MEMLQSLQNVVNNEELSKCFECCRDFKFVANVANVRVSLRLQEIFALLHLCLEVI